jgi:uncharacterized protein (TIGR02594 family)
VSGLPKQWKWLEDEPGPRTLKAALRWYGTAEKIGKENNPVILDWAKGLGINYTADSTPWCGLFAAQVAMEAGWPIVHNPLWARNWAKFGTDAVVPELGDFLVFSRGKGGHVGVYVGESIGHYWVLGGNQGDKVSIVSIVKKRLLLGGARRPIWKVAPPPNRRVVKVNSKGVVSTNEV